jgi:hypothetical protein
MSGASRWLEWFATTTKPPERPSSRSRSMTVTAVIDQMVGLSTMRWAT